MRLHQADKIVLRAEMEIRENGSFLLLELYLKKKRGTKMADGPF